MKNNINYTGQITAAVSFVIGTCLLSFYLNFGEGFMGIGSALLIVILMIITNVVIFIAVLGAALLNKKQRPEGLKTCAIMLINIPISILYLYMVLTFPNQNLIL